jgi:uncharacterized protein (DUF2141 family)
MKKLIYIAVFTVGSYFTQYTNIYAQTEKTGKLTILITNLENTEGQVVINLYRKGDDIMGKPFIQKVKKFTGSETTISIENLSYGSYSVFAFHDKNANGDLDHNRLNMPAEPFGYSNNWNFGLFTGMPTFEKTSFNFSVENTKETIKVE